MSVAYWYSKSLELLFREVSLDNKVPAQINTKQYKINNFFFGFTKR